VSIRCPKCGNVNRDGANFCFVCRHDLRGLVPSQVIQTPLPVPGSPASPAQPLVPAPVMPIPPPIPYTPAPVAPPSPSLLSRGALLRGTVTAVHPERPIRPPFDPARALFYLAVLLTILPPLIASLAVVLVVGITTAIVFAILGIGISSVCLMCLSPLIAIFLPAFFSMISSLAQRQSNVPLYAFTVEDAVSGQVHAVEMLGQRYGADLKLGYEVEVWGRRNRRTHTIRSWKVVVHTINGAPAASGTQLIADRPFSWIVAGIALAIAIFVNALVIGTQMSSLGLVY